MGESNAHIWAALAARPGGGASWAFTPQTAPAQDAGAPADQTAILKHLNAVVTWYRQLASANESAGQPSDTYYLDNSRGLAKQVVELAFESAGRRRRTFCRLARAKGRPPRSNRT